MGEWTELERTLEGLLAAGNVEVHEDGEWLPEFTDLRCELRATGKAPMIHLWSGERNLVRRILRVAECAPGLRFHPMTDVLLRYLAPEVQVTRVGLNEGWRHKVQVIFRM
jgi:hypothetical protein